MPDSFPHSTISWVVFENKIVNIALQKQPIFLLDGEVIWQASYSLFTEELYGFSHPKRNNLNFPLNHFRVNSDDVIVQQPDSTKIYN